MDMYDKESLKVFAGDLGLRKISQLRKADLIERIAEEFLAPENLYYRLATFDDPAMKLFREASIQPMGLETYADFHDLACRLNEMEVAVFDDAGYFSVLPDVWKIYEESIAGDKFEAYRARASWVWKCVNWAEFMYVYTPRDIMLKVINRNERMRMTEEELHEIFGHFPEDLVRTFEIHDVFIDRSYLVNEDALRRLRMAQGDKDYYIPKVEEVNEFYETGALLSHKPYQDMLKFLTDDMDMVDEEAEDILYDLWDKITYEGDPHEAMQWFWDQFEFEDEAQVQKVVSLFMPLMNGTNLLVNRGYAPADMPHPAIKPGQMPTIVPGSSDAAKMLSEAMPELQKMGFGVDLDSNATTVPVFGMPNGVDGPMQMSEKKIYPNDPCPCGSGKKYKKCCGKNR